ncbi:DUF21 domain-containing protein [Flavobacteriaceae bacterium AH-315-O20]|nr:DUF21 domain-containing protein [Flavobacteriaceae bacterium AH-315-O20]
MKTELIIRSNSSDIDFALLIDGKLVELHNETLDNNFSVGDVFLAKVRKTLSGLNAAFVNVGSEKDAFLHYHDLGPQLSSLKKYSQQVSTGKRKEFTLKNFRIEKDIDKNGKIDATKYDLVSELLENPKKLLATILISNNFINILFIILFTYIGDFFFGNIASSVLKFSLEIVFVTFLILLFGEVLPKIYANRNAMKFAAKMAKPMKFLNTLLSPVSYFLLKMTSFLEKKLSKKQSDLSVETLSQALKLTSTGATTKEEKKILQGIVNFGNTETSQIMCPRMDIFALSDDENFKSVIEQIIKHGHSRIPVYNENIRGSEPFDGGCM